MVLSYLMTGCITEALLDWNPPLQKTDNFLQCLGIQRGYLCTIRTAEKGFLNLLIPCKESCTGLFRTGEKKMSEMSRTGRESFTDLSRTGGKIGLRSQDVLRKIVWSIQDRWRKMLYPRTKGVKQKCLLYIYLIGSVWTILTTAMFNI